MSLSNNNTLTEYGSGPRRSQSRRSVYVDEPAKGFFVTGSSIKEMNGIYYRVNSRRMPMGDRTVHLAYTQDGSGNWGLVLCDAVEDSDEDDIYQRRPDGPQWVFLDNTRRERIAHKERNTLVPGAGTRWQHVTTKVATTDEQGVDELPGGGAAVTKRRSLEEEEDELPWQVIALLDGGIVNDLRWSSKWREQRVQAALTGSDLPKVSGLAALEIGDCLVYRVTSERAPAYEEQEEEDEPREMLNQGDYLAVTDCSGEWLGLRSGLWVRSSDVERVDTPLTSPPETEIDELDSNFDKPFEPRIADVTVEEQDEDDDEEDDIVTEGGDENIGGCCQGGRLFEVGAAVSIVSSKSTGTVTEERSVDSKYTIDKKQAVHASDLRSGGDGDDAWILGVTSKVSRGSLLAAYRASARDAAAEARLGKGKGKGTEPRRLKEALDRLLAAASDSKPPEEDVVDPLEAVLRGDVGLRAQDAGRKAETQLQAALSSLRQVVCDAQALEHTADECLLRVALTLLLIKNERDEDARREAQLAMDRFGSMAAGPLVAMGSIEFRSSKREKGALLYGQAASSENKWASTEARRFLRSERKAHRFKRLADDEYARGDFASAAQSYGLALEAAGGCSHDKWLRAVLYSNRSACHRRNRKLALALEDADSALALYPRFSRALFRRACALLEANRPRTAKRAFVDLLRVDRDWPSLCEWLVRATAQEKRLNKKQAKAPLDSDDDSEEEEAEDSEEEEVEDSEPASSKQAAVDVDLNDPTAVADHFTVLGVTADVGDAELKRAYRLRSLKYHPDKKLGSTLAFQRVNDAFQTLSDPGQTSIVFKNPAPLDKRASYEMGEDLRKKPKCDSDEDEPDEQSLREVVERKYFPERYEFWPFGDPFVEKRRLRARRAKQAGKQAWDQAF